MVFFLIFLFIFARIYHIFYLNINKTIRSFVVRLIYRLVCDGLRKNDIFIVIFIFRCFFRRLGVHADDYRLRINLRVCRLRGNNETKKKNPQYNRDNYIAVLNSRRNRYTLIIIMRSKKKKYRFLM